MTVTILHLSDIHIDKESDGILFRPTEVSAAAFWAAHDAELVVILVSGDIAYSGTEEQYKLAEKFLTKIRDSLRSEVSCPIEVVTVPGNHDCDFEEDNSTREVLIGSLSGPAPPQVDESVIESCTRVQNAYFGFRDRIEEPGRADGDRLLWRRSFDVRGHKIWFECLNVSWVSKKKETLGSLYFPISRYSDAEANGSEVRIVTMHHPANWFSQTVYRPFRKFVHSRADILITGHEHEGNVGIKIDSESNTTAYVEGCVLQREGNDLAESSFNLINVDLENARFNSIRYSFSGERYAAMEEGSWSSYHDLPVKTQTVFPIETDFEDSLDDPGPYFSATVRPNTTLNEIYVFPTLRKIANEDNSRELIDAERLLVPEALRDGVIVEGDERSGRTSLLHTLYREYHDRGFVPVLIRGREFGSRPKIDTVIRKAVERQYGKSQIEKFEQLPKERRVLLLDDFDEGSLKSAGARAEVLADIKKRFGYFVVSVGELFEVRDLLENSGVEELTALTHFKLEPFGYTLRGKLIERWFSLMEDPASDGSKSLAKRDQVERLVTAVMKRSIVPSVPLYLLTLLQSVEAGQSSDFRESALGYYYQYLLTGALQSVGVKADKLTELFQYSALLAWHYHERHEEVTC